MKAKNVKQEKPKSKSKYGNIRTYVTPSNEISYEKGRNYISFHSEEEANYYIYLRSKGLVEGIDFTRQNKYVLVPKFEYMGTKYNGVSYVDDFRFGEYVIDIKGSVTDHYKIKAQMIKYLFLKGKYKPSEAEGEQYQFLAVVPLYTKSKTLHSALIDLGVPCKYMDLEVFQVFQKAMAVTRSVKKKHEIATKLWKEWKDKVVVNRTLDIIYKRR